MNRHAKGSGGIGELARAGFALNTTPAREEKRDPWAHWYARIPANAPFGTAAGASLAMKAAAGAMKHGVPVMTSVPTGMMDAPVGTVQVLSPRAVLAISRLPAWRRYMAAALFWLAAVVGRLAHRTTRNQTRLGQDEAPRGKRG